MIWPRHFRQAGLVVAAGAPAPVPRAAGGAILQWRRGVSIGEALADARRQAGLTVSQVSMRTRIRETIIRDIERDEYSACGGDFYARGHIRAIAHAVGADPGPVIREYDASQPTPHPVTAADLFRPVMPVRMHERHRLNWAWVLGLALVVALGLIAYHLISGPHQPSRARPAAGTGPVTHRHAGHGRPHPAPTTTRAAGPYAGQVVIHLTAVEDCWVEFTTPGAGYLSQAYDG